MLDGRYPSSEFGELRPRIVWDRVAGTIRARTRSAPAGGHQRRHDPRPRPVRRHAARRAPRRRARRGDGLRGAARADVPARRVDLADRGDRPRPRDRHAGARRCRARCRSGRATGSAARRSSARRSARSRAGPSTRRAERCERDYDLDARAARNLLDFLREQQHATRVVPSRPHDRGRALPRRDRRLAAVRAVAVRRPHPRRLGARARAPGSASSSGLEADAICSDDGIIVHLPDAERAAGLPSSR